jgi:hypothetical protein
VLAGEAGLLGRLAYRFARYQTSPAFTPTERRALTYAIAVENQRSRFNHALGITDQGFTSGAACRLPDPRLGGCGWTDPRR